MTLRPRYSATFNSALNTSSWAEVAPEMFIGGLQPINLLSTVQELVSGPTRCVAERKREGKREKGRGKYMRKAHCVCLKLLERLLLVQSSLSLSFSVKVIFKVFFVEVLLKIIWHKSYQCRIFSLCLFCFLRLSKSLTESNANYVKLIMLHVSLHVKNCQGAKCKIMTVLS